MKKEQEEALMRIPIVIVCAIIWKFWAALAGIVALVHWVYELATAKRHREMAKFNNYFITYSFNFLRYGLLTTNKRPFPWNEFGKEIEKVDMKKSA